MAAPTGKVRTARSDKRNLITTNTLCIVSRPVSNHRKELYAIDAANVRLRNPCTAWARALGV